MLETGFGFVTVVLLAAVLCAASHQAGAAWLHGQAAPRILSVAAAGATPSGSGGDSHAGGTTLSATASANATSSGSAVGEGTCSAEATSEAEVRIGSKVVRKSAHKRATETGSGCSASSESSAEANSGPPGQTRPGATPQQ